MELDKIFGIQEQALKVFSKRADVLSNNIANSSTPNYKARDIDFVQALSDAEMNNAANLMKTSPGHIALNEDGLGGNLVYRVPMQPSLDGNTVDPDVERVKFMENAMKYQVSLNFVSSTATKLKKAFQGE